LIVILFSSYKSKRPLEGGSVESESLSPNPELKRSRLSEECDILFVNEGNVMGSSSSMGYSTIKEEGGGGGGWEESMKELCDGGGRGEEQRSLEDLYGQLNGSELPNEIEEKGTKVIHTIRHLERKKRAQDTNNKEEEDEGGKWELFGGEIVVNRK